MAFTERLTAAAFAALTAILPVSGAQAQEDAQALPRCHVAGKVAPGMSGRYTLIKKGFAWLIFEAPVMDFQVENLNQAPGLEPFMEFSIKRLADGSYDKYFTSMIYLGDLTSPTTGKLVDNWKATLTYGDVVQTYDNMNMRLTHQKNPEHPSRIGLVGGRTTAPETFIQKLEAGTALSIEAYNEDNPAERVSASIDMAKAAEYFEIMKQQDDLVRKMAAEGGCDPV